MDNASLKVSVVVPCLNRADYLEATLKSILKQDYAAIECIVVDGGSTDGTVEMLKGYGDRIKWVSEPDNGHADAINKGWKMSGGEILAWLNADDVWAVPDAVSRAAEYFAAHPDADLVYGDCGAIDDDGNLVGMSYLHDWDLEYAVVNCDFCIPQPAAFIRRRILEKVGWLDVGFVSKKDHELWPRIGLAGEIRYIPVLLAHARVTPGYMSKRGDITAQACVALTEKFFTLPNVPERIASKKKRAISNAYLRGMEYAWSDGRHVNKVFNCVWHAAMADPKNVFGALRRLRNMLASGGEGDIRVRVARIGLELLALPVRALRGLRAFIRDFGLPRIPNLIGDRDIEWSWIASQIPPGPGEALDFGPGESHLGLIAAQKGFNVTAVDMEIFHPYYIHPRLRYIQADILKLPLPMEHFDLVINCSAIEHVGLSGRYSVTENLPDGDLAAMARLRSMMKPGGTMLLTIPVGRDAVFAPLSRVYGKDRLPRLLDGFKIEKQAYWVKNADNRWVQSHEKAALNFEAHAGSWDPAKNVVALGCFVLKRS